MLAIHVVSVNNLVIGKFDLSANEAPGLKVPGLPTFRLHTRDNKVGFDY